MESSCFDFGRNNWKNSKNKTLHLILSFSSKRCMYRFLCHVFTLAVILYLPDGRSWKILVPIYIKNGFQNV